MATADCFIRQGDTVPILTSTILDQNGNVINLTGASVSFTMRTLTSSTPLTLAGSATVTNATTGAVQYAWNTNDTQTAGLYMGEWHVTESGGATYTYPNDGYLTISVEESLKTPGGGLLVSLPDAKAILNIAADDRTHDAKIIRFINGIQVIIESIVGPVIVRTFEEWADGGNYFIRARRRPSSALGTSPVMTLMACSEYRGPIEYTLSVIPSPDFGSIYSAMMDTQGTITRRTAGGGVIAFPAMPRSVHYWYQAGQSSVPWNIYQGTLELLREHYQQTQQAGRGRAAAYADEDTATDQILAFLVSGKVREWLAPTRRHPSIA